MTLQEFNSLPEPKASEELLKCCGSGQWVKKMVDLRPFANKQALLEQARIHWDQCGPPDWLETFKHHPKIGDLKSLEKKFASTRQWAGGEQKGVNTADHQILAALAQGNDDYEKKYGYIFIVCATGKSAGEMLEILKKRLSNQPEEEIQIAQGEQMKITLIRLEKLLN